MNVLISGLNGTVAPYVADEFKRNGSIVFPYDRDNLSTENAEEIEKYLNAHKIQMIVHLAMGSVKWSTLLAEISKKLDISYVYISTVSVFSNKQFGPYTILDHPNPEEDYGKYKRESEIEVLNVNQESKIIRLGWQIGYDDDGKNQMLSFIYKQMRENGYVSASSKWYPSCSFLNDSAKAVYQISQFKENGIFHVNSNDDLSFYEICNYLSKIYPHISVKETSDFEADHRMSDSRVEIKKLSVLNP